MSKYRSKWMGVLILSFVILGIASYIVITAVAETPPLSHSKATAVSSYRTPRALLQFLSTQKGQVPPSQMDQYLFRLIELQDQVQPGYERQLFSPAINPELNTYTLQDLAALRIPAGPIKELIRKILADGFRLASSEGMIYIEINYPRHLEWFGKHLSRPVTEYLRIMAKETERHFSEDAGLMITPDQLAARIVAIEKFNHDNPGFPKSNEVLTLYRRYFSAYLIGLNNTPAFDYQTGKLADSFYQSYRKTVHNHQGTKLAATIQEYLRLLKANDFYKSEEILSFAAKYR